MDYVGRLTTLISSVHKVYNELNPATLSGAIDIIVVEQSDGELACSPFHVRFGKLALLLPSEKKVEIVVNGQVADFPMKVGDAGEAFFVFETDYEVPEEFQTSPLVSAEYGFEDEPPYLDLGATDSTDIVNKDEEGYVSAHSAEGDDFESDSEDEIGDVDHKRREDVKSGKERGPVQGRPARPSFNASRAQSYHIPPELQSPKMIVEEVLDKTVTKLEPFHDIHESPIEVRGRQHGHFTPNEKKDEVNEYFRSSDRLPEPSVTLRSSERAESLNGVYTVADFGGNENPTPPRRAYTANDTAHVDGGLSSLQEEVDPGSLLSTKETESIVTTTVTRQCFVIRPAYGNVKSTLLEVRHVHNGTKGDGTAKANKDMADNMKQEQIVLDMAGYKTEENVDGTVVAEADNQNASVATEGQDEEALPAYTVTAEPEATNVEPNAAEPQIAKGRERSFSNPIDFHHKGSSAVPVGAESDLRAASPDLLSRSPLSDSGLDYNSTHEPIDTVPEKEEWSWGWGSLPMRKKRHDDKSGLSKSQTDANINGFTKKNANVDEPESAYVALNIPDNSQELPHDDLEEEQFFIEMSHCGADKIDTEKGINEELFKRHRVTYEAFVNNPSILNDKKLVFRLGQRYYNWEVAGPLLTSMLLKEDAVPSSLHMLSTNPQDRERAKASKHIVPTSDADQRNTYSFGRGWRKWLNRSSYSTISDGLEQDSGNEASNDQNDATKSSATKETTTFTTTTTTTSVGLKAQEEGVVHVDQGPRKNYAKTLRLTSEQLKSLNLKKGQNSVSFSVTSAYQGKTTCVAKIFLWSHSSQIVISDIDGTITKSDALGHVFTMIGKDWTHSGVAKLFTDIVNNDYKIMYLTSRAIGQASTETMQSSNADYTRDYLSKVEQDNHKLPDGPVIMSPDRLLTAFHREVIMRKPEVFKMACLRDVQKLFEDRNPFYAGFGNRITDALSYRHVNVPASRIFTIDSNGDVKLELLTGYKSSYIHLNDLVDQIFPPLAKDGEVTEEYNDFHFWKQPLPKIDLPDLPEPPRSPPARKGSKSGEPGEARNVKSLKSRGLLRSFTSLKTERDRPPKPPVFQSPPALPSVGNAVDDKVNESKQPNPSTTDYKTAEASDYRSNANDPSKSDNLTKDERPSAALQDDHDQDNPVENSDSLLSTSPKNVTQTLLNTMSRLTGRESRTNSQDEVIQKECLDPRSMQNRDTNYPELDPSAEKSDESSEEAYEEEDDIDDEDRDDELADIGDLSSIPY